MNKMTFVFDEDDMEAELDRICPRGTHRGWGLLLMAASAAISMTGYFYLGKWVVSLFG